MNASNEKEIMMPLISDEEIMMSLISGVEQNMKLYPNVELLHAYAGLIKRRYEYTWSSHVYPDVVARFDEVIEKLEKKLVSILEGEYEQ